MGREGRDVVAAADVAEDVGCEELRGRATVETPYLDELPHVGDGDRPGGGIEVDVCNAGVGLEGET